MKLATFEHGGVERIGLILEGYAFDFAQTRTAMETKPKTLTARRLFDGRPVPSDMISFLDMGDVAISSARHMEDYLRRYLEQGDIFLLRKAAFPLDTIRWRAPVPRPGFIFGLTGNCPEGWRREPTPIPDYAVGLLRPWPTIRAHLEPVTIPPIYPSFRYTIEMGVILGRGGKGISEHEAMDHVVGYACFNDMVSDHWKAAFAQQATTPLVFRDLVVGSYYGRSTDQYAPFGPYIATKDEVGNPYDLMMYARHNGVQRDRAHSGAMIISIERAIAQLSRFMTLPTGAVLHMGTMGVDGYLVAEDERMLPGEYIEIEIEKVGTLRTPIHDHRLPLIGGSQ